MQLPKITKWQYYQMAILSLALNNLAKLLTITCFYHCVFEILNFDLNWKRYWNLSAIYV